MRKQWYRKIRLYLALGAMVCSLSGCGTKEQESVSLEKNDGKENRTEIAKESEENKVLEVIEELTKDVWVNTKITVYNSEDTSLSPRTMTEMTYDQEGRLLTKYVTDYELAQYPFVKETLEYEYDKDGNILKHLELNEMHGTKTFQTFRYDDNGNKIAEMKDDNSVTLYEYDENGRLMAERTHMADPAAMGDRAWAMDHPGEVFSPNQIYEKVWKDNPFGTENTVAVHIRHLREKIEYNPQEPRYLKVVWGRGYKMEGD